MDQLFHLVDADEWSAAVRAGEYRSATLSTEGFTHCSFGHQVAATAARHYGGVTGLVVVELDPSAITAPVRVEDTSGRGVDYPHVYGPIPVTAAVALHELSEFRPDGDAASPDR